MTSLREGQQNANRPWAVYIVRCADDTLYTGATNDVEARMEAHNRGAGARYTRSRRPVTLLYTEYCESRSDALSREHAVKRLTRAEKLKLARNILVDPQRSG
ncbi:MAG: GIY-YIG nuclease family protein [Gammaproteobacteria bacterium]|nr:GIY-YIG nuclease family protein [Gammaproteobacteria bacterium]